MDHREESRSSEEEGDHKGNSNKRCKKKDKDRQRCDTRSRPTNNQLLYKAIFKWEHYEHPLAETVTLPVDTDACASVTSAFLQALKILQAAESMRKLPSNRNILRMLSENTRKTKVVELSAGTHRVPDETKRHCLVDHLGSQYSTNLDRNRYGSDDNYLFTVIRYDLEYLRLCPLLIDVEIIDVKSKNATTLVTAGTDSCKCGKVSTPELPSQTGLNSFHGFQRQGAPPAPDFQCGSSLSLLHQLAATPQLLTNRLAASKYLDQHSMASSLRLPSTNMLHTSSGIPPSPELQVASLNTGLGPYSPEVTLPSGAPTKSIFPQDDYILNTMCRAAATAWGITSAGSSGGHRGETMGADPNLKGPAEGTTAAAAARLGALALPKSLMGGLGLDSTPTVVTGNQRKGPNRNVSRLWSALSFGDVDSMQNALDILRAEDEIVSSPIDKAPGVMQSTTPPSTGRAIPQGESPHEAGATGLGAGGQPNGELSLRTRHRKPVRGNSSFHLLSTGLPGLSGLTDLESLLDTKDEKSGDNINLKDDGCSVEKDHPEEMSDEASGDNQKLPSPLEGGSEGTDKGRHRHVPRQSSRVNLSNGAPAAEAQRLNIELASLKAENWRLRSMMPGSTSPRAELGSDWAKACPPPPPLGVAQRNLHELGDLRAELCLFQAEKRVMNEQLASMATQLEVLQDSKRRAEECVRGLALELAKSRQEVRLLLTKVTCCAPDLVSAGMGLSAEGHKASQALASSILSHLHLEVRHPTLNVQTPVEALGEEKEEGAPGIGKSPSDISAEGVEPSLGPTSDKLSPSHADTPSNLQLSPTKEQQHGLGDSGSVEHKLARMTAVSGGPQMDGAEQLLDLMEKRSPGFVHHSPSCKRLLDSELGDNDVIAKRPHVA